MLLETRAAQTGAARTDAAEELQQAARLQHAMDDPELARETFHELDALFQEARSSLAGNAVIATMLAGRPVREHIEWFYRRTHEASAAQAPPLT
ncbi:MAG: GntR family transcriptional regulator [Arthrobacter sp.]|nr:GntR family transcriptional regulator [Arthrobacter sp.]